MDFNNQQPTMTENVLKPSGTCRKIAVVVGAGVSGVQAARALLRAGYDVLILEQSRGIGGVWRRNYHSFALQVPWSCYTFPEFPYSKAPPELHERVRKEVYPSGHTVQEYISAYCAHFGLDRHILLGAKVVHLAALPGGRWAVRFRQGLYPGQPPDQGALKTMEADVVVIATGMFYSPYVPAVPGLASFKGRIMHARDFTCVDPVLGKRVLVLGAGKSAHDCAVVAASPAAGAAAVTAVFRQAHWPLPRVLFGVPFYKIVYTRFTAAMLPMYYTAQSRVSKRVKHALLSPLKRLFWATLEGHVTRKLRLRGPLKPETGFVQDMFFGGQVQDGSWNEAVNAGRIRAIQGCLSEVLPSGVRLGDGTMIECDVIIFATGYAKDYSLFDAATASRLLNACPGSDGLHLYRSVVSPWAPNLYFIGSEAASFNNVLTSGLQSLWMIHHLLGSIKLPSSPELMKDVLEQRSWRQRLMPRQCYSSSAIMLYQQRYHDQLVSDMRHKPHRKRASPGGGSEYFGVYVAEDYSEMFCDAEVVPLAAAAAAAPPPRTAAEIVAAAVALMPAAAHIGARFDLAVLPTGGVAGNGGGGGVRRASAYGEGGLVAVCDANSGGAAIAVAPGVAAGVTETGLPSSTSGVIAAQAALGTANTFMGSFENPRALADALRRETVPCAAACPNGHANCGGACCPDAAAATVPCGRRLLRPPASSYRQSGPSGHTGAAGADGGPPMGCPSADTNTVGLDTTATIHSAGGAGTGGRTSRASPTMSAAAAAAGAPMSVFTTEAATAAGAAATASGTPSGCTTPSRPKALVQRVKLQVLHMFDRSPGGSLLPNATSAGDDILELRVQSNTGAMSTRMPESSLAATSQAACGTFVSSSICCDPVRHAAPNVYSELVGTLDE